MSVFTEVTKPYKKLDDALTEELTKHYGPDAHPNGSSQADHGGFRTFGESKKTVASDTASDGKRTVIDHGAFMVTVERRKKRDKKRKDTRQKLPIKLKNRKRTILSMDEIVNRKLEDKD